MSTAALRGRAGLVLAGCRDGCPGGGRSFDDFGMLHDLVFSAASHHSSLCSACSVGVGNCARDLHQKGESSIGMCGRRIFERPKKVMGGGEFTR